MKKRDGHDRGVHDCDAKIGGTIDAETAALCDRSARHRATLYHTRFLLPTHTRFLLPSHTRRFEDRQPFTTRGSLSLPPPTAIMHVPVDGRPRGREAGAVVESVGPGVTSVAVGDPVIPCYTPQVRASPRE